MSEKRLKIRYDGINDGEAITAIQRNLEEMESVEVHEIGINTVDLSFDRDKVQLPDFERVISQAGGQVRNAHQES